LVFDSPLSYVNHLKRLQTRKRTTSSFTSSKTRPDTLPPLHDSAKNTNTITTTHRDDPPSTRHHSGGDARADVRIQSQQNTDSPIGLVAAVVKSVLVDSDKTDPSELIDVSSVNLQHQNSQNQQDQQPLTQPSEELKVDPFIEGGGSRPHPLDYLNAGLHQYEKQKALVRVNLQQQQQQMQQQHQLQKEKDMDVERSAEYIISLMSDGRLDVTIDTSGGGIKGDEGNEGGDANGESEELLSLSESESESESDAVERRRLRSVVS
jgi:hypothetical protein